MLEIKSRGLAHIRNHRPRVAPNLDHSQVDPVAVVGSHLGFRFFRPNHLRFLRCFLVDTTIKGFRALAKAAKGRQIGGEAGEQMVKEAEDLADEAAEEARQAIDEGIPQDAPEAPRQAAEAPEPEAEAPAKPEPLASPEAIRAALADKDNVTVEQVADSLWFNPSKMDGPIEGQKMIEVAGDALARSGALEKLGIDQPETFEAVTKAAQEELAGYLGVGLDAFTARVAKVGEAAVEQSKFLVAGKTALLSVGNHISTVARQLDAMYAAGKIDPEVEAKLLSLMETHTNLQGHLKQVQTAAARAVSVGRIRTQGCLC